MWIPLKAQVKERARFRSRRRGGPYTPIKTVEYEKAVRRYWSESNPQFEGPVGIQVAVHKEGLQVTVYECEESVRPVGILGDADNLAKSLLDGLQPHKSDPDGGGGAFANDRQVERLEIYFVGLPRKARKTKAQKAESDENVPG